jgi:hypothetical protein
MYLYYPVAGWSWVAAPWLWGSGPAPYFGLVGPEFYAWFGIGLGHWYGFTTPFWSLPGRAYFGGAFNSEGGYPRGFRRGWHR